MSRFFLVVPSSPYHFQRLLRFELNNGDVEEFVEDNDVGILRVVVRSGDIGDTLIQSAFDNSFGSLRLLVG